MCQSSEMGRDRATRALRPDKGAQSPPCECYRRAHISTLPSDERRIAASPETCSPSRADISGSSVIAPPPQPQPPTPRPPHAHHRQRLKGGVGGGSMMNPLIKVHLLARFQVNHFTRLISALSGQLGLRCCPGCVCVLVCFVLCSINSVFPSLVLFGLVSRPPKPSPH